MPAKKLTDAQIEDICRRWSSGESQKNLATAFSCCQATISYILRKKAGLNPRPGNGINAARQPLRPPTKPVRLRLGPIKYPDNPTPPPKPDERKPGEWDRFWSKVGPPTSTGCRLWLRGIGATGYGQFSSPTGQFAHRVAWRLVYGDIPVGMQVNHRCDVRRCVEPTHLWLGTQSENLRDCWSKGQRDHLELDRLTSRGQDNGRAILTWEKVREIRRLRYEENLTITQLADRFGVSRSQISHIVTNKQWVEINNNEQSDLQSMRDALDIKIVDHRE